MNYLDELNKKQQDAVLAVEGPVRIIAGPGSGKTRTIIAKIAYLLENNLAKPYEILVITFTNKAANEVKERLNDVLGEKPLNVYTYHGWAARLLRIEAENLGINKDYRIIDISDRNKLVKKSLTELEKSNVSIADLELKEVTKRFDDYSLDPNLIKEDKVKSTYFNKITFLYKKYLQDKKHLNALDFNDLLLEVHHALKKYPDLRKKYQEKYKYIFIDEFQDTNNLQYDIIKYISTVNSNITVVGDPDQNIYSWRGANIDIILNFNHYYKNTRTFILNTNYRSTPEIIKLSNNLINHNKNRIAFDNFPTKINGTPITIITGDSKEEEAWKVVQEIQRLRNDKQIAYHDVAIIYRSNYVSLPFENQLLKHQIPYILVGGFKFFERKEVKDSLNYLHFLCKKDLWSLLEIINMPARGIGVVTLSKLQIAAANQNQNLWEYLSNPDTKLPASLVIFVNIFKKFMKIKLTSKTVANVLRELLVEIGLLAHYDQIEGKSDNIYSLLEQLKTAFNKKESFEDQIINFFNNVALFSSTDKNSRKDHVTLITGHAAKGTEFKVVFFVGLNEGIIPSKWVETIKNLEEERRIAYVAITRAKDFLYLSYASGTLNYPPFAALNKSRFLIELDSLKMQKIAPSSMKKKSAFSFANIGPYNENTNNVIVGDIIYHKNFGEGVVVSADDEFITVAFHREYGVKEILKGHSAYVIKLPS